jgi:hypothetical protein
LLVPLFVRSTAPIHALDARLVFDAVLLRATRARLARQTGGVYYAFNGEYQPGVAALALASATALPLDDDGALSLHVLFEPLDPSSAPPPVAIGDVVVDEQPAAVR